MSDGRAWKDCDRCEGSGGYLDGNGDWVDCSECEGAEGWVVPDTPSVNPA